jgi:beta-lactamase regulating signal transducer with metallopeptidase domain
MLSHLLAVTLILWVSLFLTRRRQVRRRVSEVTVLLCLLLPLMIWAWQQIPQAWQSHLGKRVVSSLANSDVMNVFFWLWAVGAGFAALRLLIGARKLKVCFNGSVGLSEMWRTEISQVLAIHVDEVSQHFAQSRELTTPIVVPARRALVILPRDWAEWSPAMRAAALHHEWQHVQARDAWWQVMMQCFGVLLWFHPLAWQLIRRWRQSCEELADQAALQMMDAVEYAAGLLHLVKQGRVWPQPSGLQAGLMGDFSLGIIEESDSSSLEQRIRQLLESSPETRPNQAVVFWSLFWLGSITLASAWFCSHPTPSKRPQDVVAEEIQLRLQANAFPADEP